MPFWSRRGHPAALSFCIYRSPESLTRFSALVAVHGLRMPVIAGGCLIHAASATPGVLVFDVGFRRTAPDADSALEHARTTASLRASVRNLRHGRRCTPVSSGIHTQADDGIGRGGVGIEHRDAPQRQLCPRGHGLTRSLRDSLDAKRIRLRKDCKIAASPVCRSVPALAFPLARIVPERSVMLRLI